MNQALTEQKIPDSWKKANIIMIPKDNSDLTDVRNYRPISLLNIDYKLFANILADRLKGFLKDWIKEDQTGFLPQRHLKDNVRIVIDIIEYYEKNNQKECALMALDAEKAFDNVNWDFLLLMIKELDMGHYFTNAIMSIYDHQEANITINGTDTRSFKINKGTRQGCPLSPLLFILCLETLLNNIREDKTLTGTKIRKEVYKVRAFADDLICIIENPLDNILRWMTKIEEYGKVAGLKINKNKTMILTKNLSKNGQDKIKELTGIQVTNKLKYLGITITPKNAQLLKNNYETKWKEVKKDMENWKHLNLSLMGRIATIKMNILPKMLFLFQTIPILRSTQTFKNWNKDLAKFIWQGKKPRIKFVNLTDDKKRGGFGLPDLKLYYEASTMLWIKDWSNLKKTKILTLEGFDLRGGWHSYLWYDRKKIEKNFGNHFIRSALIKTWEKYKNRLYQKTPLWLSPLEALHRRESAWETWPTYKDVLQKVNGIYSLKNQEEINKTFKNVSWFQYRQLAEYFNKDKKIGFMEKETVWDKIIQLEKKEIARTYKVLLEWSTETEMVKDCMIKWASNIGHPIKMEDWERNWNKRLKYTYAYDLRENWYKMMYRWYITPQKLARCYKNLQDKCWKCQTQEGTFFHMWWTCKNAKEFWTKIHGKIQEIIGLKFQMKPEYFLLGMPDFEMDISKDILFNYLVTAARIIYARNWKLKEVPRMEDWKLKILDIRNMDKLTQCLKRNQSIPKKSADWTLLKEYLK
uniref:Reverse transcriptase domain-containing protein n=1 Tax=Anolis carolinensis TaxID=28377 RepID=A0A803TGJ8_ANOCA